MFKFVSLLVILILGCSMVSSQTITATGVTTANASIEATDSKCKFSYTLSIELAGGATAPASSAITMTSASNKDLPAAVVTGPVQGTSADLQSYTIVIETPVGTFSDFAISNGDTVLTSATVKVPTATCSSKSSSSESKSEDHSSDSSSTFETIGKFSAVLIGASLILFH